LYQSSHRLLSVFVSVVPSPVGSVFSSLAAKLAASRRIDCFIARGKSSY